MPVTRRLFAGLLLSIAVAGNSIAYTANWNRDDAMALARAADTSAVGQDLFNLTLSGDVLDVLDLLQSTANRTDWPDPVRDHALYEFAQQLRTLPPSNVPSEVITWLKAYRPATIVPQEDHPRAGVPLFNVRAVAAGIENAWLRQDALLEGLALLQINPRALVDVFLIETHPAARGGYLDTLDQATAAQLAGLSKFAVRRLRSRAELTPLAGKAAILSRDLPALETVFALGQGPALAHLMRQSSSQLNTAAITRLLTTTLSSGDKINAALAIAELGGVASVDPLARDVLLESLGDVDLGASAALALARNPSPDTLAALQAKLDSADPLTAARARMTLDLAAAPRGGLE